MSKIIRIIIPENEEEIVKAGIYFLPKPFIIEVEIEKPISGFS